MIRGGWGLFYDAFSQDMFLGHLPWHCVFCPGPAYPALGRNRTRHRKRYRRRFRPRYPGLLGIRSRRRFLRRRSETCSTPYIQNFNLNFQQQLGSKSVLQVGYVGAKGTKLFQFKDINQPSQEQITAADLACVPDQANGVYCPSGYGVPRTVAPNFFYLNQEQSSANSIYNALQVSLRTSGWHGLTSQVNFVWSHSIDTASDLEDFEPNQAQPQNSTNPTGDPGTPASTFADASLGTSRTNSPRWADLCRS